jgi:hypothetical protein
LFAESDTLSAVRAIETKGWELRALDEGGDEAIEQAIAWHKRILDIGARHPDHLVEVLDQKGRATYNYHEYHIAYPKRRGRKRKSETAVRLVDRRHWDGRNPRYGLLEWPSDERGLSAYALKLMTHGGGIWVDHVDEAARALALQEVTLVVYEFRDSLASSAEILFRALDASPVRAVSNYATHQEARDFDSLVQIYELGEDMPSNLAVVESLSELLTSMENEVIDEAGMLAEALRPAFVSQRKVSATGRFKAKGKYKLEMVKVWCKPHRFSRGEVRRVEVLCRQDRIDGRSPVEQPDRALTERPKPKHAGAFLEEADSILANLSADQSRLAKTRLRQIAKGRAMGGL